jgi:hypothetical protein
VVAPPPPPPPRRRHEVPWGEIHMASESATAEPGLSMIETMGRSSSSARQCLHRALGLQARLFNSVEAEQPSCRLNLKPARVEAAPAASPARRPHSRTEGLSGHRACLRLGRERLAASVPLLLECPVRL